MSENGRKQAAAVYVSWATFRNALDQFVQVVPNQVDRTAFPGMSDGVQSQLFAGLRFLRLINDESRPTPALHALAVPDEAARKRALEALLRERYAGLFALDLLKATPAELNSRMEELFSVTGGTRERAVRFFLGALDYLGIPVSKFLKRESIGNGTTIPLRRRRGSPSRQKTATVESGEEEDEPPATSKSGMSKTVTLKSGGTLTMSVSLDLWTLSDSDQEFIFELIKKVKAYEAGGKS